MRFVGVACRTSVLPALRLRERFGNGIRYGHLDPGRVEGWGRLSFQRLRSRSSSGQADKVAVVCMLENSCNAATTWLIHGPLTVAPEISSSAAEISSQRSSTRAVSAFAAFRRRTPAAISVAGGAGLG